MIDKQELFKSKLTDQSPEIQWVKDRQEQSALFEELQKLGYLYLGYSNVYGNHYLILQEFVLLMPKDEYWGKSHILTARKDLVLLYNFNVQSLNVYSPSDDRHYGDTNFDWSNSGRH